MMKQRFSIFLYFLISLFEKGIKFEKIFTPNFISNLRNGHFNREFNNTHVYIHVLQVVIFVCRKVTQLIRLEWVSKVYLQRLTFVFIFLSFTWNFLSSDGHQYTLLTNFLRLNYNSSFYLFTIFFFNHDIRDIPINRHVESSCVNDIIIDGNQKI